MRLTGWLILCMGLGLLFLAAVFGESAVKPDAISELSGASGSDTARAAMMDLTQALRSQERPELQSQLCLELSAATDPMQIRKLCLVLSAVPNEEAILIAQRRLDTETVPATKLALCDGLGRLLSGTTTKQQSTIDAVSSSLGAIIGDRRAPHGLIESAELGIATLGPAGFDLLMKSASEGQPNHKDAFYTVLGATGDPRALAVLRSAVDDPSTREGLKIEALHAMGTFFSACSQSGQPADPAETSACAEVLHRFVGSDTPDQLFTVALRSLGNIVRPDQDSYLRAALLQSINSDNAHRRESTVEVLYQTSVPPDANTLAAVQKMAASDTDPSVKATAEAVIDRFAAAYSNE